MSLDRCISAVKGGALTRWSMTTAPRGCRRSRWDQAPLQQGLVYRSGPATSCTLMSNYRVCAFKKTRASAVSTGALCFPLRHGYYNQTGISNGLGRLRQEVCHTLFGDCNGSVAGGLRGGLCGEVCGNGKLKAKSSATTAKQRRRLFKYLR